MDGLDGPGWSEWCEWTSIPPMRFNQEASKLSMATEPNLVIYVEGGLDDLVGFTLTIKLSSCFVVWQNMKLNYVLIHRSILKTALQLF